METETSLTCPFDKPDECSLRHRILFNIIFQLKPKLSKPSVFVHNCSATRRMRLAALPFLPYATFITVSLILSF